MKAKIDVESLKALRLAAMALRYLVYREGRHGSSTDMWLRDAQRAACAACAWGFWLRSPGLLLSSGGRESF